MNKITPITKWPEPAEAAAYRYQQYLICQQRGHDGRVATTIGEHHYSTCKYCGTDYWTELTHREDNVPTDPSKP